MQKAKNRNSEIKERKKNFKTYFGLIDKVCYYMK